MTKLIIRTQFSSMAELDAAQEMGMVEGFAMALDRLEELMFMKEN
jgi:uncharacterized protein YndB with AHSA1/START domain